MKRAIVIGSIVLFALTFMSCSDGFLKPYNDHDERLFGSWSNYSIDTMEGDAYFFYKDLTFKQVEYEGWKNKDIGEYYERITEGSWSTKEGKLRLSTELFDKKYEIIMRDSTNKYLLLSNKEYLKF